MVYERLGDYIEGRKRYLEIINEKKEGTLEVKKNKSIKSSSYNPSLIHDKNENDNLFSQEDIIKVGKSDVKSISDPRLGIHPGKNLCSKFINYFRFKQDLYPSLSLHCFNDAVN